DALIGAVAHEVDAALAAELTGDAGFAARQYLDHLAFATARRVVGAHGHAIAFPQELHFARGEIEVVAAVVGLQETEAVAMRGHDARDDVQVPRETELVRAIAQQLAVANHGAQPRLERAAVLLGLDAEPGRQRFEQQRLARLLHGSQDFVAARDLVFILALALWAGAAG